MCDDQELLWVGLLRGENRLLGSEHLRRDRICKAGRGRYDECVAGANGREVSFFVVA